MDFSSPLSELFRTWKRQRSDRVKLQHAYFFGGLFALVVSGLVSLVNAGIGRRLVLVAGAAFLIFVINALVWGILVATLLTPELKLPEELRALYPKAPPPAAGTDRATRRPTRPRSVTIKRPTRTVAKKKRSSD